MPKGLKHCDKLRQLQQLQSLKTAASHIDLWESQRDLSKAEEQHAEREAASLQAEQQMAELLKGESFSLDRLNVAQAIHASAARTRQAASANLAEKEAKEQLHGQQWQANQHLNDYLASQATKASRELSEKRANAATEEATSLNNATKWAKQT